MPLRDLPPLLWLLAALAAVAVVGFALFRNFRAPESESRPPVGALRWLPPALIVLMAVGTFGLAPSPDKGGLAIAGLVVAGALGWGMGMGPSWAFWRDEPARDLLARAAAGLGLLVLTDALVPDPVMASYVVMGGLLGFACTALPLALAGHTRAEGLSSTLGLMAALGAGLVWGDRAFPDVSLGSAWALGFAALTLGISYAMTWLPRSAAPFVGAGLAMALAAPLGFWGFRLEANVVLPSLMGLGLAVALSLLFLVSERTSRENAGPLPALALVLVAGGCLLLANRLFGMFGVSLAGIGLSLLVVAQGRAPLLAGILVSGFAGRAFLQLFLDRTYLNQYGVDLTHTYTSFGLIAAFFIPFALAALRRTIAPAGIFVGIEALAVLVLPALMGYFIHVDPLASYLAGLLVTTYVLGILAEEGLTAYRFAPLMPPVLISASAVGILSAPWLITVLNVPRKDRLIVFACLTLLLLAYLIALVRQRPAAPAEAV
ncbi:hypothetical protein D3C86_657010 [compost metagenome]